MGVRVDRAHARTVICAAVEEGLETLAERWRGTRPESKDSWLAVGGLESYIFKKEKKPKIRLPGKTYKNRTSRFIKIRIRKGVAILQNQNSIAGRKGSVGGGGRAEI